MPGREDQAVSPVHVMRNEAAAGRPANEGTQQSQQRDVPMFLGITERRCAFGPGVKTQYRLARQRCELQQGFIQCHVEIRCTRTRLEEQPGFGLGIHTLPAEGQSFLSSQWGQSGLRAEQRRLPCQINQWLNSVHSSRGTSFINSCSIFSGSFWRDKPSRCDSRATCVSTTMPSFLPKAFPKTTFAVLRPTPF